MNRGSIPKSLPRKFPSGLLGFFITFLSSACSCHPPGRLHNSRRIKEARFGNEFGLSLAFTFWKFAFWFLHEANVYLLPFSKRSTTKGWKSSLFFQPSNHSIPPCNSLPSSKQHIHLWKYEMFRFCFVLSKCAHSFAAITQRRAIFLLVSAYIL